MTQEELEHQNFELTAALGRANTANKELGEIVSNLTNELNGAIEKVRYLNTQLTMREAQQVASKQYNDNERNY